MENLTKLELKMNKIISVETGAFKDLRILENLALSANNLENLPSGIFVNTTMLIFLNLQNNKIKSLLATQACGIKRLKELLVNSNKLTSVKFDKCFSKLLNLQQIDLSDNPIGGIVATDLYALRNSPVSVLKLSNINLTYLSRETFKYVPRVLLLDLGKNKLSLLEPNPFSTLPNLTYVNLRWNKLHSLPNVALSKMKFIEILDLEHNRITSNTLGGEFKSLKYLRKLSLQGNPLVTLTNESFSTLKGIMLFQILLLDSCKLQEIESDTFLPLASLTQLKLSSNPLNANILEKALYGLRFTTNLTKLELDATHLTNLNNKTFQYLVNSSLEFLSLKGCSIIVIKGGTFQYLPKLRTLDLQGSWIKTDKA